MKMLLNVNVLKILNFTPVLQPYITGVGGGEALKKLILGGRGSTPYLFICHLWWKRYPLCVPSIDRCSISFAYLPNRKSSCHFQATF